MKLYGICMILSALVLAAVVAFQVMELRDLFAF